MYPLFETIRLSETGAEHFGRHLQRMQESSRMLWGRSVEFPGLLDAILSHRDKTVQKCRVFYNENDFHIDCEAYSVRPIEQLQLVIDDQIDYSHKWSDRTALLSPIQGLPPRADVLFVKNGFLSDTSYANIALWNGKEWHTPSSPLLNGIRRAVLLEQGRMVEKEIAIAAIRKYETVSLLNAMLDLGEVVLHTRSVLPPVK